MRRNFPLWAKILAWFFGNLALLAAVGWLLAQHQLRGGMESLLAGSAGDRIRSFASIVVQELSDTPRGQWDDVLARFERAYPLRLALFNEQGAQLAGAAIDLPKEVRSRVQQMHPPRSELPERGPRRPRPGPPPPRGEFVPDGPPPGGGEAVGERRPEAPAAEIAAFVRSENPRRYWVLLRAPLSRPAREGRLTLAIASETLGAGGLFFDPVPLLWIGLGALGLSILFWLPLVRGIAHSVASMQHATARIAEGRFDIRVSDRRRDELGALGASINTMSERLAGLVNGQRRFLSDVAHELCAPLSRLQMAFSILEERAAEGERERLRDVREEVDHMAGLVNELLSFSRASLGSEKRTLRPVAMGDLLERAARREAGDRAKVEIACEPGLLAHAEPDLLERAVGNLLRNAVRYAGDTGPIRATASARNDEVFLSVADSGPGVPAESLPHLFDPFFRVDTARTRETGGVGLGLTIAKTCVEACKGTISARPVDPTGLEVVICLPRSS